LADCVGHGYSASLVARHIHKLLHRFHDIRDTARLLAALNDEFTLDAASELGLRLTTVVTGTYDGTSGEFNFAYAAHPRMLVWRAGAQKFYELGEGLENLPLGFITGEQYNEQSIRLNVGDMILAFSDGATEAHSPQGEQLTQPGFLALAERTLRGLPEPVGLPEFSDKLLAGVQAHRGHAELEDDVTLLTLRRMS
jgi:sigma-B regulation protein RsbU (phosphoserine phosphatase)